MHIDARQALTVSGWRRDVRVTLRDGLIETVEEMPTDARTTADGVQVGILLPSPANLHSHAFQRALAGLTESRGAGARDSFWTWRTRMYRFLESMTPDDVRAIAALVQMEMLEAGFAAIGEFHYLHHGPDGVPYDDLAEMAGAITDAARLTGIGLTLLPVAYAQGGCDGRPLEGGQRRFGNDVARFAALLDASEAKVAALVRDGYGDAAMGLAPHSLRALSPESLRDVLQLRAEGPVHIHASEQVGEVDEVRAALGAPPVRWLLQETGLGSRWCLIHATQAGPDELSDVAASGAVVGLCPITESNLGDGIFDAAALLDAGGRFGIGSDSDVRISLSEELRALEYSQRLRDKARACIAEAGRSSGRVLLETAAMGGAQALGRHAGRIGAGYLADLLAIDDSAIATAGLTADLGLDAWIFAGDDRLVTDVWSGGRHVVRAGGHIGRERILSDARPTLTKLRERL